MEPHTGLAEMEQLVRDELHQYLPGGTGTEMIQLVEAVARCATSLADRQTLKRSDVLLARPCTVDCAWYVRSASSLGVFVASSLRIPAAPWSTCSPTYLDLCRRRAATEGGPPPVVANWPHSRHGPTADEFASDAAEVVRPDGVVELRCCSARGTAHRRLPAVACAASTASLADLNPQARSRVLHSS
jgi:hypothetical protein